MSETPARNGDSHRDRSDPEEEFRLAPLDDGDELGLAALDDDDAEKIIAPEVPPDTTQRLIPVVCSACKTRLYATEEQIGMWKRCPDCGRLSEILYVEPKFRYVVETDESGGYSVKPPEVANIPQRRIGVDYRNESLLGGEVPEYIETRVFADEQPRLEKMLQSLLDSGEEKEKTRKTRELRDKIEREVERVKRERNTKSTEDPIARLIAEKEGAAYAGQRTVEEVKPDVPSRKAASVPVPPRKNESARRDRPSSEKTVSERSAVAVRERKRDAGQREREVGPTPFWPGFAKGFEPFFSSLNRKKLIVLFVIGFLANLCLEKVVSIVVRVTLDADPGKMMTWADMGMLGGNFFLGVFFGIVWLMLVLMFGISILMSTSQGNVKVKNWVMFDLHLGASYVFWTALILFVSGYPGMFLIWGLEAVYSPFLQQRFVLYKLGIFLTGIFVTFPVLFLSITETDTFFGGWPKRTLGSLMRMPGLWAKFFLSILTFAIVPVAFLFLWVCLNLDFYDRPWIRSNGYYLAAAFFKTLFWGFFPLIYFRFLGRVSWVISQEYPKLVAEDEE